MNDTIAAIATPVGVGGVGMIRVSGEITKEILQKVFRPVGARELSDRRMTYGHIVDKAEIVDEVLCVFMKAPATYTCEDVGEIYCHGGQIPLRRTLSLILRQGARLAEPGEFTKRAFLNGRIDLAQAEAVMDLVSARADKAYDVAVDQLEGVLSGKIRSIRASLVDILVDITVNIDYPDEDIEEITYEKLAAGLSGVGDELNRLLAGADSGRILREGLRIAIVGKPNVGKSSLMNALLRESRAIVTDIPGTTRDTIEEQLSISGIPVVLTDTAGIRETDDQIESIGIERSKKSFNEADLVIHVLDGSIPLSEEDMDIMEHLEPSRSLVVINKTDLEQVITKEKVHKILPDINVLPISAREMEGLEGLEGFVRSKVEHGNTRNDNPLVTNVRHQDLLEKAAQSITDAQSVTSMQEPLEIIEIDVNSAYGYLGEILGEETAGDVLDEVFSRFCLGK
jgi:tRNA modification GTPase